MPRALTLCRALWISTSTVPWARISVTAMKKPSHDGVAHATTAHRTFRRMERTPEGGLLFPPEQLAAGGRCSVYAVDQTGRMRVAEVRLPAPPKPAAEPAAPQQDPSTVQPGL